MGTTGRISRVLSSRRLSLSLAWVMFMGLTLLSPSAQAQGQGPPEDAADYIERTGELLEVAYDQIGETSDIKARRFMTEAYQLHQRSLQLLDQGNGRAAVSVSMRARKTGQQAVRLAREAQGKQNQARIRLERYGELYDQILDRARDAGDEMVMRFIRESEKQAIRARDQYRQGNHDMTLQLLKPAEALLDRAARLLFEGDGVGRLDDEIDRTRELIERIADQQEGSSGKDSPEQLKRARDALDRAIKARDRGQPMQAMRWTEQARRHAMQAAGAGGQSLSAETVSQQIERWDERYERVAEQVRESNSGPARKNLDRALQYRDQASRNLDDDELEQALRQIRAAFDILNKAHEMTR